MKNYEFLALKDNFYRIQEAIQLHNTGNHPEYDKDTLDELLDGIHEELCDACSNLAKELIYALDHYTRPEIDEDDKHYLETLFHWAIECRNYSEYPEESGLNDSYGRGNIDVIGADFYVGPCDRSSYRCFGYSQFAQLLETYELINY